MGRRSRRTSILNFEKVVNDLLKEYGDDVYEVLEESVEDVVHDAVYDLRAINHFAPGRRPSGDYAASWTNERVPVKRLSVKEVIYNEDHYRLTHLLEHGHVIKNGTGRSYGKAPAYPHIKGVEEKAQEAIQKEIIRRLGNL